MTSREAWWGRLRDPAINALVAAALENSPTLSEAAARVDEAKAVYAAERAPLSPRVDLSGAATQARTMAGENRNETAWESTAFVGPRLSWEIDLWGRVRHAETAANLRIEVRAADARAARLSIAAQVAEGVIALRACHLLIRVRDLDITSREKELAIIRARVRSGSMAPVEVATAETNLAQVRMDRIAQDQECGRTSNGLVALSGRSLDTVGTLVGTPTSNEPEDWSVLLPDAPAIAPRLPAVVLAEHPNVIATEREAAARWEETAVARASRLPRLDLAAVLTGQWISAFGSSASVVTGSAGPSLSASLFDRGAGRAEVARADSRYRQAVARLDDTLRQAVRDIEDGLLVQALVVRRLETARAALSSARFALRANEARRRAGSIGAFELEESRRQFNRAQEGTIMAARDRSQAWVELIRRTGSAFDISGASTSSVSTRHGATLPQ